MEQREFMLSLLEVVDAFERVFRNIEKRTDAEEMTAKMKLWNGNFMTVLKMLKRALVDQGIEAIETGDGVFDPGLHNVVGTEDVPGRGDGDIVEVVLPGYTWSGRVLRRADVIVARHEDGEERNGAE